MKKFGQIYRETTQEFLNTNLKNSASVFIVQYQGIGASSLGMLRQNLKDADARFFVAKNSLAKMAMPEIEERKLQDFIDGQVGFIFIKENPVMVSKVLKDFMKENQALIIKGGILQDKVINNKDIESLANLPNRETLIAMVVMGMKAPITSFVLLLNQLLLRLVLVIKSISEKKK